MDRCIPIYRSDGKTVGHVEGDEYHTARRRSVHLLRQPPGWAIDLSILRELEARGVRRVILRETEEGSTYEAELSAFRRHGVRIERGHGEQIALPLIFWRVNGAPSEAEKHDARPAQLVLDFGGAP